MAGRAARPEQTASSAQDPLAMSFPHKKGLLGQSPLHIKRAEATSFCLHAPHPQEPAGPDKIAASLQSKALLNYSTLTAGPGKRVSNGEWPVRAVSQPPHCTQ